MKTMIVMCVLGLGCAASSEDDPGCRPRVGSYVVHHVNKSGDCGTPSDEIVQISENPQPDPACSGGFWVQSELNCKTTGDTTCTATDGRALQQKGACRWSSDGATGTCEVQITLRNPDGSLYCTSLFEQTYRRQ
jgi:hypothetical protein